MKTQGLYKGELFSTDISVLVAQIKKFQKTRCIYFQIWLLGGPSPPSQLVPNPFNWSPNTVFYIYLCIGRSNQKISKNKVVLFSNFASGRTLPTQSTGPQPIQLVPKHRFLQISLYRSLKSAGRRLCPRDTDFPISEATSPIHYTRSIKYKTYKVQNTNSSTVVNAQA